MRRSLAVLRPRLAAGERAGELAGRLPRTPEERAVVVACEQARTFVTASGGDVGDAFEYVGSDRRIPVQQAVRDSAPQEKGLVLYRLVRAVRPTRVVEFGAAFGISGSYMAAALRDNGCGALVSVEAAASRREIAQRTIDAIAPGVATVHCGLFDDCLDLITGAQLFFLDGNHYADPSTQYLNAALDRMARPGWIVFDDISDYSTEMSDWWTSLRADRRFSSATIAARMGVVSLA